MTYLDTNARSTRPLPHENLNTLGRFPTHFGTFLGFVKRADDVQRNGRLQVWIPEFGTEPTDEKGWVTVVYCSPFAGATNVETISKTDLQNFEKTQTSYGLWMVPPDINNEVIVLFINGDPSRGIWVGSLYNQFMDNMVPAMASDVKNYQYPGSLIPVAEYNKWDKKVVHPDRAIHPYEKTKFRGLGNQGLITDKGRGVTNTGARRESPSAVFGIITPGPPINPGATPENIRRKGGSSFVMDDGIDTEYIQLVTKTGAQIRLDETNGFVYLINRDGTAWVQMDQKGNIDIFGARDISMRAQRDINIRADRNINFEAGQNIYISAAKDTKESTIGFTYDINNKPKPTAVPWWKYVGRGNGDGGNIVMEARNDWHATVKKSTYLTTVDDNMHIKIGNALNVQTLNAGQDFNSKMGIKMTTDAKYEVAASSNIRLTSGGIVSVIGSTGVVVCSSDDLTLKASNDIISASGGSTNINATVVDIPPTVRIGGGLSVNQTISANHVVSTYSEGGASGSPNQANPAVAESAISAALATMAELKPLNSKLNILATWADALEPKFNRDAHGWESITTRWPTYEPCPEHETFSFKSVSLPVDALSDTDKTYAGSAGAGNPATSQPPPAAPKTPEQGAENKTIKPDSTTDSNLSKDLNINALRCQLSIHEGVKNTVYRDTGGLPTGGIGHLLRSNEISSFPVGSTLSAEQIETWYSQDSASAIAIAQRQMGPAWNNLSEVQKRGVVDLAYNLGEGGLAKFTKFNAAMKAGDYTTAGQELKNSVWYTQVGRRGPAVITMITQGVDPNGCDKKWPQ